MVTPKVLQLCADEQGIWGETSADHGTKYHSDASVQGLVTLLEWTQLPLPRKGVFGEDRLPWNEYLKSKIEQALAEFRKEK